MYVYIYTYTVYSYMYCIYVHICVCIYVNLHDWVLWHSAVICCGCVCEPQQQWRWSPGFRRRRQTHFQLLLSVCLRIYRETETSSCWCCPSSTSTHWRCCLPSSQCEYPHTFGSSLHGPSAAGCWCLSLSLSLSLWWMSVCAAAWCSTLLCCRGSSPRPCLPGLLLLNPAWDSKEPTGKTAAFSVSFFQSSQGLYIYIIIIIIRDYGK